MTNSISRRTALAFAPTLAVFPAAIGATMPLGAASLLPLYLDKLDQLNALYAQIPNNEDLIGRRIVEMNGIEDRILAMPTTSLKDLCAKTVTSTGFGLYDCNKHIIEAAGILGLQDRLQF